ncbi:MAG: hypothetical protein ABJN96_11055 [Marinomonas sp.]
MKAIKLASIFAVSAVAAAVSTTTMAAEGVFSGTAGLNYVLTDGAQEWVSEGEVNITIDTGVVYVDLDMEDESTAGSDGGFDLDEIYIKQGAVKFGDFDGSISDDAVTGTGVYLEDTEYSDGSVTDLGIQYAVSDELTVALEMAEGYDGFGFAASFSTDLEALTLKASAGSYSGEDVSTATDLETTNFTVGVEATAGIATLGASYSAGTTDDVDFSVMVLGADFAISEAVSFSAQYNSDIENEVNNLEITAYYTAGDVTYYAANVSGDAEATVLGAYVSF